MLMRCDGFKFFVWLSKSVSKIKLHHKYARMIDVYEQNILVLVLYQIERDVFIINFTKDCVLRSYWITLMPY